MELRYYINTTQISEPIGFDDFKTILKRTKQHGVSAESSIGELEFDGVGFGIIQTAYNTDIDTELIFKAEIKCDDDTVWGELYSGILDLSTYEETFNDYCGCKVKVGEIGVKTTFNNRVETVVQVSDDMAFDIDGNEITPFPASYFLIMPVKKIFLTNSAKNTSNVYNTNWVNGMSTILGYPLGNEMIREHSGYNGSNDWGYVKFFTNPSPASETFKIRTRIAFSVSNTTSFSAPGVNDFINQILIRFYSNNSGSYVQIQTYDVTSQCDPLSHVSFFECDVDFDYALGAGKSFECRLELTYKNYTSGLVINFLSENSQIRILKEDVRNTSVASPFLVHETLNKITQYISGITVKSDYYGRFNSQINPLADGVVGAGAMKSLITGFGLRNRASLINLSFKDIIHNLSSIDNIGFGFSVEDDTLYIRVENWKWFYNSNVLLTIDNPSNKKRTINAENVYSRLSVGYKKTIAVEELNAIDSFHGSEFRSSTLKAIDNEYKAISDFIADPFAIELTRRAGLALALDTKDWKYDESIFVLALKMDESGIITVEQGATNENKTFLSTETMTNVRLSPVRNALRFMDLISNNIQKKDFNFTSGTGNTSAICSPISLSGYYYLDGGNTDLLSENESVNNVTGYLKPELITFEHPLTRTQFEDIKADPYGQIIVDGEACYVDEIIREVMTGMCEFKLIPKI